MISRTKNILKYTVFTGLAVLLLWLAFRNTEPTKLLADLRSANYAWVLLSMVMGYSAIISRGYRWLILLEPMGYKPRLWNSIHAVSILYLVNIAVPRAGEVARCTALNQAEDIPVDKLFGTVIIERLVDLVMMLTIVGVASLIYFDELIRFFNLAISGTDPEENTSSFKFFVLGGAVVLAFFLFILRKKIMNHPKFAAVRNFWNGVKEGLNTVRTMRRKRAFILHTIYIWLMYYGMLLVVFPALPFTEYLGPGAAMFIMVAAAVGIIVPVPGGIGAYHYLVMLALSIIGLSKDDGLTYATIVHSSQTLQLLLGGLVGMVFFSLQKRKRNREVR